MADLAEIWVPPIITGVVTVVIAIYSAASAARRAQSKSIESRFAAFEAAIKTAETAIEDRLDVFKREIGETMKAFREKTHQLEDRNREIELFVRDRFVPREEFRESLKRVEDTQERIEKKLDAALLVRLRGEDQASQ